MRYTTIQTLNHKFDILGLKVGQWFRLGPNGHPGQYMGCKANGEIVTRHGKFSKANAKRNKLQRLYAKS